jgi:2-keto-4-pentenoate hydratase/2-oxohepta-3-ene-1,7-dioic acid hydratase in catechol pathway
MRWCRFELANKKPSFGIIEGDQIIQVNGSPFAEEGYSRTTAKVPLKGTKLLAPVIPPTFYATGRNYAEHLADRVAHGSATPHEAWTGYRASNALVGTGETVIIPPDCPDDVEYEGELVAVIGKKARHLTQANAMDVIFGYTIGNDISGMTWHKKDTRPWRSKNTDTWKPMGPWIETDFDVTKAKARTFYNGKLMVEFKVDSWIFSVADVLCAITKYMTVYPGDIIWMGAEGVSPYMKHGDVVEIEIDGIGRLTNPVIREKA